MHEFGELGEFVQEVLGSEVIGRLKYQNILKIRKYLSRYNACMDA